MSSLRSAAAVAPAERAARRADGEPPLLRLFWYPMDSADIDDEADRGRHLAAELVGAAQRLGLALDELRAATSARDLSRSLDRLEFRLENFATRLSDLRERLLRLFSEAAQHPAAPSPRRPPGHPGRPHATLGSQLAAPVEDILALIDDELPVRDPRARRSYLHICLDDGAAPRNRRDAATHRRRLNRHLRSELGDLAAHYAERVAQIIALVVALLDRTPGWSPRS